MELDYKNTRLKEELVNNVYDVISSAVTITAKKHRYKKYDIFKLVSAIYSGEYGYITNKCDYRAQVKLLDEYFRNKYKHSVIVFEMIKQIKAFPKHEDLILDIENMETIIRTGKKDAKNLKKFSGYLKEEKYEELMTAIDNESSLRYAVMIMYDKVKLNK